MMSLASTKIATGRGVTNVNVSRGAAGNKCPHATAARVHARRPLLPRRPNATVAARASSSDADGEDDGSASKENGFYGDPNFDGNMGPFIRPEGSPFFAAYNDPTVWRLMQQTLRAAEVEQVLPAQAKILAESKGWTLVDIRPYPDYCDRHAWGAMSAQLYVPMKVKDLASAAKAAATVALFPERLGGKYVNVDCNEYFLEEMQEAVKWGDKVIVYCDSGGVIGDAAAGFAGGLQTTSLIAAHELVARGWGAANVKHMAGGLGMWDAGEGFECGEVEDE
mmetsp:Transcript_4554/g.7132  ORF Transcript_4554/g.7132 Transcript_4554/m.7132 type:complete len:279 (-) Transcript_4554:30-866(-)